MSFLGALTGVLKPILKIAPLVVTGINPAIGALVTAGAAVVLAEIEHGDGTGAVKMAEASRVVLDSPVVATSPLPADARAQHIRSLIDGVVAVLNALAGLFPAPSVNSAPEPKP
jgi:hypothetical protein